MPAPGDGVRLDARWVLPVEPFDTALEWASVVVRGDRVADVAPTAEAALRHPDLPALDLRDQILLPGLINAHTHAAMTLLRGLADDMALKEWLETRIWPTEARMVDHRFVADGTRLASLEMLLGGTTAFSDMYFYSDEAIRAAVAAGMRIHSGIVYLDVATGYARTEAEYLERGMLTRSVWRDHPLVGFSLAPHATYSTSAHSLERIHQVIDELGIGVHTHLHETAAEVEAEKRRYGRSGVGRLLDAGALRPGFSGAHAIHMDDDDIEALARTGASVVHCPSSNMKLASGISPVWRMIRAGVNVALGTDGAASNNRLDMWQEMRTAALLAKVSVGDAAALPAHQALRMATLGGAAALGRGHDLGSLVPGKFADVVAVDISSAFAQPLYDPASHLVYVLGREQVRNVWVAGRRVVADGHCTTVNADEVLGAADEWADRLRGD